MNPSTKIHLFFCVAAATNSEKESLDLFKKLQHHFLLSDKGLLMANTSSSSSLSSFENSVFIEFMFYETSYNKNEALWIKNVINSIDCFDEKNTAWTKFTIQIKRLLADIIQQYSILWAELQLKTSDAHHLVKFQFLYLFLDAFKNSSNYFDITHEGESFKPLTNFELTEIDEVCSTEKILDHTPSEKQFWLDRHKVFLILYEKFHAFFYYLAYLHQKLCPNLNVFDIKAPDRRLFNTILLQFTTLLIKTKNIEVQTRFIEKKSHLFFCLPLVSSSFEVKITGITFMPSKMKQINKTHFLVNYSPRTLVFMFKPNLTTNIDFQTTDLIVLEKLASTPIFIDWDIYHFIHSQWVLEHGLEAIEKKSFVKTLISKIYSELLLTLGVFKQYEKSCFNWALELYYLPSFDICQEKYPELKKQSALFKDLKKWYVQREISSKEFIDSVTDLRAQNFFISEIETSYPSFLLNLRFWDTATQTLQIPDALELTSNLKLKRSNDPRNKAVNTFYNILSPNLTRASVVSYLYNSDIQFKTKLNALKQIQQKFNYLLIFLNFDHLQQYKEVLKTGFYFSNFFDFRGRKYPNSSIGFTNHWIFRHLYYYGSYSNNEVEEALKKERKYHNSFRRYEESLFAFCKKHLIPQKFYLVVFWGLLSLGQLRKAKWLSKSASVSLLDFLEEGQNIYQEFQDNNFANLSFESRVVCFRTHRIFLNLSNSANGGLIRKYFIFKDVTGSGIQNGALLFTFNTKEALTFCNLNNDHFWCDTYTTIIDSFKTKYADELSKFTINWRIILIRKILKDVIMIKNYSAGEQKCLKTFLNNITTSTFKDDQLNLDPIIYTPVFKLFHNFLEKDYETLLFFEKGSKDFLHTFQAILYPYHCLQMAFSKTSAKDARTFTKLQKKFGVLEIQSLLNEVPCDWSRIKSFFSVRPDSNSEVSLLYTYPTIHKLDLIVDKQRVTLSWQEAFDPTKASVDDQEFKKFQRENNKDFIKLNVGLKQQFNLFIISKIDFNKVYVAALPNIIHSCDASFAKRLILSFFGDLQPIHDAFGIDLLNLTMCFEVANTVFKESEIFISWWLHTSSMFKQYQNLKIDPFSWTIFN